MKIKYSALVMGVSGKLNGSVGATNKGGAYLRNKGVVSNPNTPEQAAVRSRFGSLSSQFRALTPTQIAAWNSAAANFPVIDRLGDTRYLTGLGLFVQLNNNRLSAGLTVMDNPPAKQAFPAIVSMTLAGTVSVGAITELLGDATFSKALSAGSFIVMIKASPVVDASVSNVKNKLRAIAAIPVQAGSSTEVDVLVPYTSKFGASAAVGQRVTLSVYLISSVSGEASAPFDVTAILAV